jgi:RNA polymerase sigma factor (sigma-70 family)
MDTTSLLVRRISRGDDTDAWNRLGEIIAPRLYRHAEHECGGRFSDVTVAHAAWLRVQTSMTKYAWADSDHFFRTLCLFVRREICDRLRRRRAEKRGGDHATISVDSIPDLGFEERLACIDRVALRDALAELRATKPQAATALWMRFAEDRTIEETAARLVVCASTVKNLQRFGLAFVRSQLEDQ